MSVAQWFQQFCTNLTMPNVSTISDRYKKITKAANTAFWTTNSETVHSWYVGSYGRNTAIKSLSDLDILFQLPSSMYYQFNAYLGNGQSSLLQAVRSALLVTYPSSYVGADGQIVAIYFSDGVTFEILPCFINDDNSFTHADTNNMGSWKKTNPFAEINAFKTKNVECNSNLVRLGRMIRSWRDRCNVSMSGWLIDTLAYQFIGNWQYRDKSYLHYDFMMRDFFEWLASLSTTQTYWRAPGSGAMVPGNGFQYKAKQAFNSAVIAISYQIAGQDWSAKQTWRSILGTDFPT